MSNRFSSEFDTTGVNVKGAPVDFRPTTVLEELQMGTTRTLKAVGNGAQSPAPEINSGGRGLTDTEAALRLGAQPRK
jgi:hypothetical protein